jgi:hypothetical protein
MAKIDRKHQKIFAGDVPPNNTVAKFGSLAQGAAGYTGDIDAIQTAQWGEGWAGAVIDDYVPCIQDLNALFYVVTAQMAYLFQAGIPEYNTDTPYYIGSLAHDAAGGIYLGVTGGSTGPGFTGQGFTGGSAALYWCPILSRKIKTVSDNYTVLNDDWCIIWDTNNPNVDHATVTIPAPTAAMKGRELIIKNTMSVFLSNLIIDPADASTIDGSSTATITSQYGYKRLICDGTNWHTA